MKPITHVKIVAGTIFGLNGVAAVYWGLITGMLAPLYAWLSPVAFPFLILVVWTGGWLASVAACPLFLWPLAFYRHAWGRICMYISLVIILALDVLTCYIILIAGATT